MEKKKRLKKQLIWPKVQKLLFLPVIIVFRCLEIIIGAPGGFGDLGRRAYLFSGSWGALLIILGELGSKHILLGI